jgi:hypothetical protein
MSEQAPITPNEARINSEHFYTIHRQNELRVKGLRQESERIERDKAVARKTADYIRGALLEKGVDTEPMEVGLTQQLDRLDKKSDILHSEAVTSATQSKLSLWDAHEHYTQNQDVYHQAAVEDARADGYETTYGQHEQVPQPGRDFEVPQGQ